MSLIDLDAVGFQLATADARVVLQPTSLRIEAGERVAVTGPSGAGKSTLASIVGGLLNPTSGAYRFKGEPVSGRSRARLAAFRAAHVGFVFQSAHLIDERSVLANTCLGVTGSSVPRSRARELSQAALAQVGIEHLAHQRAATLSGGERQRVALARALVKAPSLLIADEPTASLDQATGASVLDLLFGVPAEVTVMVVSHDPRITDHTANVVHVVDGRLSR